MTPSALTIQEQHMIRPTGSTALAMRVVELEAENAMLRNDAARLDWLEQHAWATERECFDFVDAWRTPDGQRHGAGLRAAIDSLMGSNV